MINLNIYLKELKRNRNNAIAWIGAMMALVILGMAFFPSIVSSGAFEELEVFFESPMMKNMMSAFGIDIKGMRSVLGFYSMYGGIYVTLLGSVFSILYASSMIAKEEKERTADFLLTKPVTRIEVLLTKFLAYFTYVLILNLIIFLTAFIGIEIVKGDSPLFTNLTKENKKEIVDGMNNHPEKVYDVFKLDKELFNEYLIKSLFGDMDLSSADISSVDLDNSKINKLMNEFKNSPDTFIENLLNSPDEYMEMFNIPEGQKDLFLKQLKSFERYYEATENDFFNSPDEFIKIFDKEPEMFLEQFKGSPEKYNKLISGFDLNRNKLDDLFIHYKMSSLLIYTFYTFILMLAFGAIGLFISIIVKRGKSVFGVSLGIVLGMYLIDAISKISPKTEKLGYISPFKFVDTDVINMSYGLDWWRLLYFLSLILAFTVASFIVYNRKDILV